MKKKMTVAEMKEAATNMTEAEMKIMKKTWTNRDQSLEGAKEDWVLMREANPGLVLLTEMESVDDVEISDNPMDKILAKLFTGKE